MAAPAVAPEGIGVAGLTAAYVLVMFGVIVLYGIQYGYSWTFGALIRKLAAMVEDIWVVGGKLADALNALDSAVQTVIGQGIQSLEHVAAKLWHSLEWLVKLQVDTMADLADSTLSAVNGIIYGEIPEQIRDRTKDFTNGLAGLRSTTDQRARAEADARAKGIDQLRRDHTRESLSRERGIDRLAHRLNEVVMPWLTSLEHGVADVRDFAHSNLAARLRALEQALAAGAVGAVAVAAMTRFWPYWQCTNVRRFNRGLCRLPVGALDDLLGAGLTILVLSDVCAMARVIRDGANAALPALRELVLGGGELFDCADIGRPAALPLTLTTLPVVEGLTEL